MEQAAEHLISALARAAAPGLRVLMVGESFDVLQALASTDLKELVVVTDTADPDAPAGETMTGAPLRLRKDWGERPRSKDLIVDPDCRAHPDEVVRILKKKGLYLAGKKGVAGLDLPYHAVVQTRVFSGYSAINGRSPQSIEVAFSDSSDDPGPPLFLASPSALPDLSAGCFASFDGVLESAETKKQMKSLQGKLHRRDEALAKSRAGEETLLTELGDLRTQAKTFTKALAHLEKERAHHIHELAEVKAAQSGLESEYATVRDELMSRRITDRRSDLVEARYTRARAEMGTELQSLRTQVYEMAETHVDFQQACGERDATITTLRRFLERFASMLEALTPKGALPVPPVPGPSEAQGTLLDQWLDIAEKVVTKASARAATREKTLRSMRGKVANMSRRLKALDAGQDRGAGQGAPTPVPDATPLPSPAPSDMDVRVRNLEQALEAERNLRAADETRLLEVTAIAQGAVAERALMVEALEAARQEAKTLRVQSFLHEEDNVCSRIEIEEREVRLGELEQMLATHRQVQTLMSEAARAAEDGRTDAEAARRLADENLRIIREEFDRALSSAGEEVSPS